MTPQQKANDLISRFGYTDALNICYEFQGFLISYHTKPYLNVEQANNLVKYWIEVQEEINK